MEQALLNEIAAINSLLTHSRRILLVSHINPDGDAIGSTLALYQYLLKKGHDVKAMVPNEFPEFLSWIKGSADMIIYQNDKSKAQKIITDAEIIICVDFNDFKRLKDLGPLLDAAPAIKLLIDHHPYPSDGFTHLLHDTRVAATAELIYYFIYHSGDRALIDTAIAESIYTGIMTDTGCFSYNSSNPTTFAAVSDLLTTGFDKDKVYHKVYDNFSENRMKLMGYCLNEKMVLLPHLHAAYIVLSKEDMEHYKFKTGDSEGFVNLPFSVKGVFITALFSEKKDNVRVSFRSRGGFAVNTLCEQHFMGGGHRNAAGGESKSSLKDTITHFENVLLQYKNEINAIYSNHY